MKRTKRIPDAINCGVSKDFTMIPNEVIKDPTLSAKAKTILFLLLSNRTGWISYKVTLNKYLKEGTSSLDSGLKELENAGFLIRVKYRNKKTKAWAGSFWAYGDKKWFFDVTEQINRIKNKGCEPHLENPSLGFLDLENPSLGNQTLIILKSNKTKPFNNTSLVDSEEKGKNKLPIKRYITIKDFGLFWNKYPRKDKKGAALSSWTTLCNRKNGNRPELKTIFKAIRLQKKSEQWQNPKYIPMASTWLNQNRWMDDPTLMKGFTKEENNNQTNNWGTHAFSDFRMDYSVLEEKDQDGNIINPGVPYDER